MGHVVPLKNIYCDLKRMQELQAIGLLIFRSEQLFASLRPTMSFDYRAEIVKRANELLDEVHNRRTQYFLSVGLSAPDDRIVPGNFKEK